MPSFSENKNQNDPVRIKGGVALQRNLEFVKFQTEFRNFNFVIVWHNKPNFTYRKWRMIQYEL